MDNKKRKILLIVIGLLLVVSIIVGTSFAWWTNQAEQKSTNIINSSCLQVAVEDDQEFGAINLPNAYPLTDLEASKLKPYKFTVRNNCNTNVNYELSLEVLDTANRLDSGFVAVEFNNQPKVLLSAITATTPTYKDEELNERGIEGRFLGSGTLEGNGFKEYTIKLWMDESVDMEDDAMNKTFKSKIIVNSTLNHIPKIAIKYTLDGEEVSEIPSKETSSEPTITCNNENVTVTWDSEAWAPILPNPVTEDAICTVAFGNNSTLYAQAEIGDYVAYTPSKTSYEITNELTGMNTYSDSDSTSSSIKSAGKQSINPSELNLWRVIKKNDDGTIEIVSEYTSSNDIYFYGKEGYRRFVGTLNEIASSYETSGITVDSHHMGYDGEQATCSAYNTCSDQKTGSNGYLTLSEDIRNVNKAYGGSETCTSSCASLKTYKSNATTTAANYWLASRYGEASNYYGRRVISDGSIYGDVNTLVWSTGADRVDCRGIRPVVVLKSGLTATEGNKNDKKLWTVN